MDSGNSGSFQSSSGGEEEFDSRAADSIFMNTHPPPHLGPIPNPPPPPRPPPPPLFDPLSNYMQQLHQNPNSLLLNPNISWAARPASTRPDQNPSTINPMLSIPSFQTLPPPPAIGDENHHLGGAPAAARNPKKRSRASRRAPTTVLTTDTTNFRAMVQEFTGIPAPPFNNSNNPSFLRSRVDLFASRSTAPPPPPPFVRRPFAQKVQSPPPFLVSSSSSSSLLSSTAIDASSTANTNTLSSLFSLSPLSSPPITQSSNLFNLQNPIFTSLLQSNPKFLFSNSSLMASKPDNNQGFEIPSNDNIKIRGLDEFGLSSHGNHISTTVSTTINGLPNLISPDQISAHNNTNTNDNNAEIRWRDNNGDNEDDDDHDDELYQAQMKRINGGYRANYSASTSNFHGEKGPPESNIPARGEGMVESWICSSE